MPNSSELYIKAREMMDEGDFENAIELFEQSISDYPHFKSLELLGECLIRLNRFSEAIIPLAAATTLNKGVRAPALLSEVFLKLKDYRQAREIAELALTRDTQNRTAFEVKRVSIELVGEDLQS